MVEVEPFLEDLFLRWSAAAQRPWRLGDLPMGTVRADPEALRSALDALLENAVKYTEVSDAIELSAAAHGTELWIVVSDEGCGIPRHAVNRIFERFARADLARTRAEGGVGLGLAIVDAIANAHGGSCTVEASERGSTFALHLPGFQSAPLASDEPRAFTAPVPARG
jgi:signal transduction histidine kinase